MLMDVESVDLNLSRHAEPYCLVDQLKNNKHHDKNICRDRHNTECLNSQLCKSSAVEKPGRDSVAAVAQNTV